MGYKMKRKHMINDFDFIKSLVNEFSVPIDDISEITGLSNQLIKKTLKKKTSLWNILHAVKNFLSTKKKGTQKTLTQAERKVIEAHVDKCKYHVNEDGINSYFFNNSKKQYCFLIKTINGYRYFREQQLDSELNQIIVSNGMDTLSEAEIFSVRQKHQGILYEEASGTYMNQGRPIGGASTGVNSNQDSLEAQKSYISVESPSGSGPELLPDGQYETAIGNDVQEIEDDPKYISSDRENETSAGNVVQEIQDDSKPEKRVSSEEIETVFSDEAQVEKYDGRYDDIIGISIDDIDESDMQIRKSKYDHSTFRGKVKRVFDEYSLLGSYQFSDRDSNELLIRCSLSMQKAMRGEKLDTFENEMLCLFMINKIKKREHKDEQFWEYIFEQLGSKAIGSANNQKAYHILTHALKKALKQNNRYFVDHGKKYYSTILAHAFSPETSLFALYSFLYHFYKDNLDWEFDENDEYTDKMFEILRKRMAGESDKESIRLSSKQYNIEIGLRILIIERPKFMLGFFKKSLRNLDLLFSMGSIESESFEDTCFARWYYANQERILDSKKSYKRKNRETVTREENIECRYILVEGKDAALSMPNIRLSDDFKEQPYLIISWGNDERRVALETYGNEFGLKVEEKTVLLNSIFGSYKSHDSFDINVKIVAGGRVIYDSKESLFRKALCFKGENETRVTNCGEGQYVFCTTNKTSLIITNCERNLIPNACDYTYYVSISEGFVIEYNGEIMCVDRPNGSFGCQPSIKPAENSVFVYMDSEFSIFPDRFTMRIYTDESVNPKSIQIKNNERIYSLIACNSRRFGSQILYELPIESEGFEMHRFIVINNDIERTIFMLNYVIIKEYCCAYDKPFYFRNAEGRTAKMQLGKQVTIILDDNRYQLIPFNGGAIRIEKPIVSWDIEGEILSGAIWYENLPQGTDLNVLLPQGTQVSLIIGNEASKCRSDSGSLDIGNSVQSRNRNSPRLPVELEILHECGHEQHKLFDVFYQPMFLNKPVFYMEDNIIKWNDAKFIGPNNVKLHVSFSANRTEALSCVLKGGDEIVSREEIADGDYDYFVFIEPESIFSDRQLIDTGTCFLGDKNATRFKNKKIKINKIREMDQTATYFETYNIKEMYIEQLSFIGMDDKFNNGVYPFYRGVAYYINNKNGEKTYFSDKEESNHIGMRYGLNPVYVHVVNDQFLIVGCRDDEIDDNQPPDGLYWDKSRRCNTDYCSLRGLKTVVAVQRLGTPDFYFYKLEADR